MLKIKNLKQAQVILFSLLLSMCSSHDEISAPIFPGTYQTIVSDHPDIYKDFQNRNSVFFLSRFYLNEDSSFLQLDSIVFKELTPEKTVINYKRGKWIEINGVLEISTNATREISETQPDTSWKVDTAYTYRHIHIRESRSEIFVGCSSSGKTCYTFKKIDI